MKRFQIRGALILCVMAVTLTKVTAQTEMPDILLKGSLKEQLNYVEERTRIFENYRAIREDMFQKVKKNVSDTLYAENKKIAGLNKTTMVLNHSIDSLSSDLKTTQASLKEMTRTKNSIKVIGLEVNKSSYNRIMWTVLGGLVAILLTGFFVFKRNLSAIFNAKNEIQELKNEFEAYRKTSREAREKLTMDHFNEIKRLKGG